MPGWILILVVVVGAAHLLAYYDGRRGTAGLLKAVPVIALATVTATLSPSAGGRYAGLITAGLLCSAVGDVCLVWPERFTAGLASFLVAHLCYVAAFASGGAGGMAWPWLVGVGVVAGGLLVVLWPHLGQVRWAVLVYVAVIAAMAWTAARRAGLPTTPAPSGVLALAGALTFMASDGVLAIDRFVRRFHLAHAVVMVTYYAAQTLIASSVAVSP
jgi:uncharacterized membrane protein YhhN